jgi:hypothetical protein
MNTIDHQSVCNQIFARIVGKKMRSTGSKALVSAVMKESINNWSKDSKVKKKLAAPVLWVATKVGKPNPNEQDKQLAADVGALLTSLARKVNADHASGKTLHDEKQGEAIDAFLQNMDFGEVLEMIEGADPHVIESIRTFNQQLWKYPAKAGALTVIAIALMNTSIKGAREIMRPIEEQFSPDLLADLILSIIRDVNGTNAANLTNTVFELIRRVHTGSLLIGKGGKPLLQTYLTGFFRDYYTARDPELARKARICLAEDQETIANAKADALDANSRMVLSLLSSLGKVTSCKVRGKSRKWRILEDVEKAGFNAAVSESVSDLDTHEVAGLINTACSVLDRVHDAKPDVVSNLVGGIVDSIDSEQVRRISKWLIPDLVEALRPLAPIVLPELIKGFNELVTPEEGAAISLSFAEGGEK